MNSNCDTFIKQENLTAEQQQICSIPDTDLSISVKNELILDEPFSSVTIKDESLVASTCLVEADSIKTENCLENQETLPRSGESFINYELETPTGSSTQPQKQFSSSATQIHKANTTPAAKILNSKTSFISYQKRFIKHILSNLQFKNGTEETQVTNSPPILLNAQLRKRHKVVLPLNPIDKRKRYNIEEKTSPLLEKANNDATVSTDTACRFSNPGSKKMTIYLIKQKQKQKDAEENSVFTKSSSTINRKNQNTNQIEQQTTTITETRTDTLVPVFPKILPKTNDIANIPKQPAGSSVTPELRVKCLCSLTEDTSNDNTEMRDLFKVMFEETRRLNKTQQRRVKMSLLKAICDAEDLVEQGKCCGF